MDTRVTLQHVCVAIYIYVRFGQLVVHILPDIGSISGPPKPPKQTPKQQNLPNTNNISSFRKEQQTYFYNQRSWTWVNKRSTLAFKNWSQHVDHLLTLRGTTYWPSFLHTKITDVQNLLEPPFYDVFEEAYIQTSQQKNTTKTPYFSQLWTTLPPLILPGRCSTFWLPPFELFCFAPSCLILNIST